ncbi:neuronal cell adhesion molecule-like isoform X2 [Xiphophorus couchianus]|uniref:neuronal cell adhesion molecule-like isoform X2 n=1 Tax=Xiphophorus couchianus TaxID=32473 RepID=UPI001016E995|nr:neuronal cell adhesion molecule-like isoform X2 [Xiphophorus couchianus]
MMEKRSLEAALLVLILGHLVSALEVPLDLAQPPTITHQSPKDYIVDPRENIIIHCEAKGKPHPSFSWTRNGTHFDIEQDESVTLRPHSGTLVVDISRARPEHYEGVFQCTARNKHGSAVSNNIVVRQSKSPLWSKEKNKPIVVQEGVSLVLPCRPPAGLPPPIIFWMDNNFQKLPQGKRVSQSLNGDLYFSNVRREDSRNDYICYARFTHTQTIQQKQPITVKVLNLDAINETLAEYYNDTELLNEAPVDDRKPTFLIPSGHSSYKMVLRGHVLEMECIAEGLPTPEVSWTKVSGDLPSRRTSFLHFNKTLRIVNVSESDEGDYSCTAKNQLGSAHHIINVEVKAAPYWISGPPKNLVLAPGENGALTCRASGTPKPSIIWSMNGDRIENLPTDISRKVEDDTIIFTDVQVGSSAVYQCNISNPYGYLLSNAFVNVLHESPRVLTPANKIYQVIENRPALMDCSSFGSPIPKIEWFKDSRASTLNGDPYILHDNGTLEIQVAQSQHKGKYTCIARNSLGASENHVYLHIKEPTRILKQPVDTVVQRGRSVTFECTIKHDKDLLPTLIWLKDDEELPDDERFIVESNSLSTSDVSEREWLRDHGELPNDDRFIVEFNSLYITDVSERDAGVYTCYVNTTLDQDSVTAELTVVETTPAPAVIHGRPDPPTDLELTDQKKRSIQLTWIPGEEHNSPIQEFVIQYEDSLHHQGHWHDIARVPGTKTTAHLKLSPYVHYTFRVLARNAVGLSEPSSTSRMYKTEPAAPDQNPKNVRGSGNKHNNLVITWEPLSGLQSNGPGLYYKVSWRQKRPGSDWITATTNNSMYTVSEIPTFSPFEIKVQAVNNHGDGPDPTVAIGYSGEDLPAAAPANVQAVVLNSTLARVRWDPVPPHLIRGQIQGYKVHYSRTHSLHKHNPHHTEKRMLTFSGNHSQGLLPGLHPFSHYSFYVSVFNKKGEGPKSEKQEFKTPEGEPGPPASLSVTNPSLDSLTLEWSPPHEHNGHITGYNLKYQPVNNSNELGPEEELALASNETSVTLQNLKYSPRYKFYLNARTSVGAGPAISQEAVVKQDEGGTQTSHPVAGFPPRRPNHKARPVSLFANVSSSVEEDGALITWEYWGPEKNVYVEYIAENSEGEEEWQKELVNGSQNVKLKGLKVGLSYRVRVVAKGHHEQPLQSEELFVTVPAVTSRQVDIATQGWFIGLMCAIALLILILLIICFIQRNKGGKYPVKEKEDAHTDPEFQPMKDDDCTFVEYSDNEDHKLVKESRTPSNGTVKRDDSDDSLVDYGEGGDGQFNEDGSFIGQYSGKSSSRDNAEGPESSGAPSPINAMNSLNSFV